MSLLSRNKSILKNKDIEVSGKISLNISSSEETLNIAESLIKENMI